MHTYNELPDGAGFCFGFEPDGPWIYQKVKLTPDTPYFNMVVLKVISPAEHRNTVTLMDLNDPDDVRLLNNIIPVNKKYRDKPTK